MSAVELQIHARRGSFLFNSTLEPTNVAIWRCFLNEWLWILLAVIPNSTWLA